MIRYYRFMILITLSIFVILIIPILYSSTLTSMYTQLNAIGYNSNNTSSVLETDKWISKRDNLTIKIKLEPIIPIIDQWTQIHFEVRNLDSGKLIDKDDLTANVTITDHDGRLYKFQEQRIVNGTFNLQYIFPDDGQHRIILQIYENSIPFTLASFDLVIPHPQPNDFLSSLFQARPY